MRTVSLIILPGNGRSVKQIGPGTTLAAFASQNGVSGRQLCLNGETIPSSSWGSIDLYSYEGRVEVAALQGSKGN
jgi:hypothetical protein